MNSFSFALTLLLASAVAAHSAQDIFARPHIAKKLTTMGKGDDDEHPCADEFMDLIQCVGGWEGDCVTCFAPLFTTAEDATCTSLAEGSYCDDVTACMTGPCADPDCSAKLKALEACDVEGEKECPGLCEVEEESPTSVWEKLFSSAKPKQYLR